MLRLRNIKDEKRFRNIKDEKREIIEDIKIAKEKWLEKENLFQEVTEPELVDFAIHELEASKIKYMYLLKKLKKERS